MVIGDFKNLEVCRKLFEHFDMVIRAGVKTKVLMLSATPVNRWGRIFETGRQVTAAHDSGAAICSG